MTSDTTNTIPWTFIAALIAALASMIGVGLNLWNNSRSRNRDALAEIASHRVRWIEEVRNEVSELLAECLKSSTNDNSGSSLDRIQQLHHVLLLKLNVEENLELISAISDIRANAYKDHESQEVMDEFLELYNRIPKLLKPVLKTEWEKAKQEIQGRGS